MQSEVSGLFVGRSIYSTLYIQGRRVVVSLSGACLPASDDRVVS